MATVKIECSEEAVETVESWGYFFDGVSDLRRSTPSCESEVSSASNVTGCLVGDTDEEIVNSRGMLSPPVIRGVTPQMVEAKSEPNSDFEGLVSCSP